MLKLSFQATIIEWRGPAPFYYAPVPPEHVDDLRHAARLTSYGWGVVPVEAKIGATLFTTSLFPKNGGYLVPLKDKIRKAEGVTVGDSVNLSLTVKAR